MAGILSLARAVRARSQRLSLLRRAAPGSSLAVVAFAAAVFPFFSSDFRRFRVCRTRSVGSGKVEVVGGYTQIE